MISSPLSTVFSIASAAFLGCGETHVAFSLGNFLNRLGDAASCQRIVYGSWMSKGMINPYSEKECRAVYERNRVCVGGRRVLSNEQKRIPCDVQSVRSRNDKRIEQIKAQRAESCDKQVEEWYRRGNESIGRYWQEYRREVCSYYVENGEYPKNAGTRFVFFRQQWSDYQQAREKEAMAKEKAANDLFNRSLTSARERQRKINQGSKEKHFYGTANNRVYEIIVPISSLQAGRTLGGSQVVDLNMRSFVNMVFNGETRARIFCAEAKHGGIDPQGGVYSLGPEFRVSGDMGRWACGRFGFYHPPAQ